MEKWKKIKETDELYSVSNYGNIKRHGKSGDYALNGYADGNGYLTFTARVNGKSKRLMIHRLVAKYFLQKVNGKELVNHIDGDKMNAHINNLEWINHRDNLIHGIKNKRPDKLIGANYNSFYGKWLSRIAKDGKLYDLGKFDTEIEAHQAYINKAIKLGLSVEYV